TSRIYKGVFSGFGLSCNHTLEIVGGVNDVGGDCSVNPAYVNRSSNPVTLWINNYWTPEPDDMVHCSGPPPSKPGSCETLRPAVGRPVDLATGGMFHDMSDLRIQGPIPIDFSRRYESAWASVDGSMGFGWQHSYMIRLTDLGDAKKKTLVTSDLGKVR